MKKHDLENFILREARSKVPCDFDNLNFQNIYNIISFNSLFDGEQNIIFSDTHIKVCSYPFPDRLKMHHRKILIR